MASVQKRVRRFFVLVCASSALLLTPVAQAQYGAPAPQDVPYPDAGEAREWAADDIPAHLAVVDGEVTLERDGLAEAADENVVLLAGDRLRTGRGRAEVLFADGSALDLDYNSSVDLLDDSLVRLLDGRLRLSIARADRSVEYRVDTAAGSAFIRAAGDYRVTLTNVRGVPELDLAVLRGAAELANDFGRTHVRAGTHALVSARTAPSLPFPANSASWDVFDRWVEDQRQARLGATSAQYLPAELRYYGGSFDQYGSWGYEPDYGRVWYPSVHSNWRPYSHGRWSFVGHFGWTWIGIDRWSWPTHHYGRWGYRNRWYWIPDRRWGPAWVSWAYAPGYVSWCPLGFNGRPVISITNIHITRVDPWIGWTVVPARSFRPNIAVARYATARGALAPQQWSQFALQRSAPIRPANLPPREVRPLRAPTAPPARGYAVARDPARVPSADGRQSGVQGRPSVSSAAPPSRTVGGSRVAPSTPAATTGQPPRGSVNSAPGVRSAAPRAQPRTSTYADGVVSSPPPSPGVRSREPAQPAPRTPGSPLDRQPQRAPWIGGSRPVDPGPAPAPRSSEPAGRQRISPRTSAPPPSGGGRPDAGGSAPAARSRVAPRPEAPPRTEGPRSSPPPSAGRPSGGGQSRVPSAPPSAGRPSGGGGQSRVPSARPPASSGSGSGSSRGQAVRRGGGGS